ncbi:DUF3037 domain-containing protein [Flavobacterium sp.]|uniref:DUF3037 domain-containing protein n=1 Tax=Flavobacterium sp. TaxID=239 RepID=UPI003F6A4B6C
MHDRHLYEYAVIRVVPKVEREEFINVGLMLYSKRQKYLRIQYHIPVEKINTFCAEFDLDLLKINLDALVNICEGKKNAGPIAQFEKDERFRWISAIKSSSIQTSRPHSGFSDDLDQTFEKLYSELVA